MMLTINCPQTQKVQTIAVTESVNGEILALHTFSKTPLGQKQARTLFAHLAGNAMFTTIQVKNALKNSVNGGHLNRGGYSLNLVDSE